MTTTSGSTQPPGLAGQQQRPGTPRSTLLEGLAALAKSALLLVGVPATLARLWMLSSPPGRPLTAGADLPAHLVLAAVGAGWLVAGGALVRDLAGAFGRKPLDPSSWSRRWAIRLAALVVMLAAGTGAAGTARQRPAAVVAHRPAATRSGPAASLAGNTGTGTGALQATASATASAPAVLAAEASAAAFGALLGAALGRRARLLRRAAAALRRPGERPPRPSRAAARLEAVLGELADATLLDWIDGANRLLWRSCRDQAGEALPDVVLVRAGPDGIELRLEHPLPRALDGFEALDGGAWWCLDPELDLDELERRTAGCGRMLPALVPVGEDGTATYLVNVGLRRRLAVTGDPERARQALSAIVLALRCLPWADELAVELVGVEPPSAAERCYQLSASSPEELAALAAAPEQDQAARAYEQWRRQPLVVTALPPTLEHEALLGRCRGRAGVVSLGGHGDHELDLDASGAWLEPLGIRLRPACPAPAELDRADRLLAEAARPAEPAAAAPGTPSRPGTGGSLVWPAPPGPADLRLLDGPARLESAGSPTGAVASRDWPRVVEVVAYLCLHAGASTTNALQEALVGPAGSTGPERLERLLAAARAGLGLASDGTALLQRPDPGRVSLHPEVTWDGGRLLAAAGAARTAAPDAAEQLLRAGLGLVGTACCTPTYPWLAGLAEREDLLATVVDAAHHLAQLALARGDTGLARWAVERGRVAEPCSEILAGDLMVACDLDGDRSGATAAWAALEDGLAHLGGNEPSEGARALHRALTGGDGR